MDGFGGRPIGNILQSKQEQRAHGNGQLRNAQLSGTQPVGLQPVGSDLSPEQVKTQVYWEVTYNEGQRKDIG